MAENIETRISSEQAKEAIYQAHLSKDAIEKVAGMNSSASEIDAVAKNSNEPTFLFDDSISFTGEQTIVLLGDSLTAKNGSTSTTYYTYASGFFTWANALTGHKFKVLKNAGIGGQTSSQILARVDSDVIALNPTHCMFLCGMNDGVKDTDTATLKANTIAIYDKLYAVGIYSFILTNTTTLNYEEKNKQSLLINNWLYEYFIDKPLCKIIDINSKLIDNTSLSGLIKANVVSDNLHPSNNGGLAGGLEIAKYLHPFSTKIEFPTSALDNAFLNTGSPFRNFDPLQLKELLVDYSDLPELYDRTKVTLGTGVNYWEDLGDDLFKLNQSNTSNTPMLDLGISLIVGSYYRVEIEYTKISGYDISSDAIGNIPYMDGVYFIKAYTTSLRLKRTAAPVMATIKIKSVKKIELTHLSSYSIEQNNIQYTHETKARLDGFGNYKKLKINATDVNSNLSLGYYPYTIPSSNSYITSYCEVFIHSANNLKSVSIELIHNNAVVSSSLQGDDSINIHSLVIPDKGLKLIIKTPLYLIPANVEPKQLMSKIKVNFLTSNGDAIISLGRCVIL